MAKKKGGISGYAAIGIIIAAIVFFAAVYSGNEPAPGQAHG